MLRLRILITKKYILKKLSRIRPSCGLIFFRFVRWSTARKDLFFLGAFFLLIPTLSSRSRAPFLPRPLLHKRDYYVFGVIEKERKIKRVMFLETQSVKLSDNRRVQNFLFDLPRKTVFV